MDLSLRKTLENLAEQCLHGAQKMHRSDIVKDIKELWRALTVDRRKGVFDYFQKPSARRAYIGYYFPMYVAKIAILLARLKSEGHFKKLASEPLKILDLGSGTLTGIAAFHVAFAGQPMKAMAVDKSLAPMRLGLDLINSVFKEGERDIFIKQGNLFGPKSAIFPPWQPNIIFLGHVLNELAHGARALEGKISLIEDLLQKLAPDGIILIVDPATRDATRSLMAIRDHFAHSSTASILAPCTGAKKCPLLMTPTSWCFSELQWQRPAVFKKIDDAIGFERESLKTSYLLLSKSAQNANKEARVVSGTMTHDAFLRRYICTSEGLKTAETKTASASFQELKKVTRGEILPDVLLHRADVKIIREG